MIIIQRSYLNLKNKSSSQQAFLLLIETLQVCHRSLPGAEGLQPLPAPGCPLISLGPSSVLSLCHRLSKSAQPGTISRPSSLALRIPFAGAVQIHCQISCNSLDLKPSDCRSCHPRESFPGHSNPCSYLPTDPSDYDSSSSIGSPHILGSPICPHGIY